MHGVQFFFLKINAWSADRCKIDFSQNEKKKMYGMPKNSEDSRRTIAQVFPGFPTLMEGSHLSSSSQSL